MYYGKLLRQIIERLTDIGRKFDEHNSAQRDTDKAADRKWDEIPRIMASNILGTAEDKKAAETYKKDTYGQQERLIRMQEKLVFWTRCAFAAAAIYASIAAWQGFSNQTAANAAKSAADTADQTLTHIVANDKATSDAALVNFKQEERAYVAASYAQMSTPPTCQPPGTQEIRVCADIHFVNSGKTPAVGIRIYRYATFGKNAEATIKALKVPLRGPPNGDLLGNVGDKWGTAHTDPIDGETAKKLIESSDSLYIYGVLQYFDIFGDYHETGFCYQRVPGASPFIECEFSNWFDQRPPYIHERKNP